MYALTNRITWPDYAPMWGYMYDTTVTDLAGEPGGVLLSEFAEPRIENLAGGPVVDGRTLPRDQWTPDAPPFSADVPGYGRLQMQNLVATVPGRSDRRCAWCAPRSSSANRRHQA